MCRVVEIEVEGKKIRVADIKQKYISNIIESAKQCSYIDRIVLFGSATSSRCRETSDIDLAIFGSVTKYKCLNSKSYRDFTGRLYAYDDHNQNYDLLYFKTNSFDRNKSRIVEDIARGEELYVRETCNGT